jgi:hypothetical protein
MKSFKKFLQIRENSELDIARMAIGKTNLTSEEETQLSMLFRVVKTLFSESPTMFISFLSRMSKGDPIMEEMVKKIEVSQLRPATNKDVKGLDVVETSATDVLGQTLGTTSFSTSQEEQLANIFSVVQMAMEKNAPMMMSFLKRLANDKTTQGMVDNLDINTIKRASRKVNSKNVDHDQSSNEEV